MGSGVLQLWERLNNPVALDSETGGKCLAPSLFEADDPFFLSLPVCLDVNAPELNGDDFAVSTAKGCLWIHKHSMPSSLSSKRTFGKCWKEQLTKSGVGCTGVGCICRGGAAFLSHFPVLFAVRQLHAYLLCPVVTETGFLAAPSGKRF